MFPPSENPRVFQRFALLALLALAFGATAWGASPSRSLDHDHPGVRLAAELQGEITPTLISEPGVLGTAVTLDANGEIGVVVYIDQDHARRDALVRSIPARLRGVAMQVEVTEKFRSFAGKPGTGAAANKVKQTPPIQLGTSGGWGYDLANGYCCGGTLGSLVQIGGNQYILSNYHVLEADTVSGGNNRVATTLDPVIQPGLIDVNCTAASAQGVGTLVKISALPNSNVDVGIAQVVPGMVRTDGSLLGIGPLSSQTAIASIGKAVKKAGRTTGLTRSSISGLNATISVAYENECAGGTAFTKTYTGQIVIKNRNSAFLAGGDSGSLMVEDLATKPKAVGLLYAGSSTTAIANPIGDVLALLGGAFGTTATMVGN